MRVIGLAGWSGAGKTTLLVKLIPVLRVLGLSVSTVKHAHHAFEIDRPGKDSHGHRAAGASEVLVSSSGRWALIHELYGALEPTLPELLVRLAPVDLVIVEGFKSAAHPKIEVHRAGNGKPLLLPDIPNVQAVASDAPLPGCPVTVIHLDDVEAIATAALSLSRPLAETLGLLATPEPPAFRRRDGEWGAR